MGIIDDYEASHESSSPRELITITHGTTTHRITTATRDILHANQRYVATAGARGEIGPSASGNGKEMTLTMPIDHAFVRRYLKQASPPRSITVTLRRKYMPTGEIDTRWIGEISDVAVDDGGTEATFRVPSVMSRHMMRIVPTAVVSRTCQHTLYDSRCGINRNGQNPDAIPYLQTATAMYVNGREVRIDLSNVPVGNAERETWCANGEVRRVADQEVMTAREQDDLSPGFSTVTKLTMQAPLVDLRVGDSVQVYAGCNRTIEQCQSRFGNRQNFGGLPELPTKNPFTPEGTGVEGF
jgi:uncharacterized phage protein (TIGR02218 family)